MVLVLGETGTGKSSSIELLDPKKTFIINVLDKPLPFRGYKKMYRLLSKKENPEGNYFSSDNYEKITTILNFINDRRPEITTVIIDDFQFLMANEFMRRASEKGYEKFTEIGKNAHSLINYALSLRPNITFFFLSHTETTKEGKVKCKTIGNMLDDKVTIESIFTTVLHTYVCDGQYKFITQNDGVKVAKSPRGMFETHLIDNDLSAVERAMNEYFNGE